VPEVPGLASGQGFLPDFCAIRPVFVAVLVGELLALALALLAAPAGELWATLAELSLFVQWVCLTTAAGLCLLRRPLARASTRLAGTTALATLLTATAACSLATAWLLGAGLGGDTLGFFARNLAVSAILGAIVLRYLYLEHQGRETLARESRARIQALQSRIRPHFLFNSMNTIASLTRSDPALAERVVEDLADLFRVSLHDAGVPVTLGRELEVCRRYLEIEQLRLGDRLQVYWEVEGLPLATPLPALTVQPLVENAVYHGVEPAPAGGWVRVSGASDGRVAELRVENPVPPPGSPARNGNRLALENVGQRLEAFFGRAGRLEAGADGELYRVVLRFPVRGQAP
jgi:two-component system sensor histidine kinase AlgZ